jgi:carboxylate-amine ligase
MRTVGVEEELLIVDPATGRPRALAEEVVDEAEEHGYDAVELELKQQQLEIATEPHAKLGDLAADLHARRLEAMRAAQESGAALAALASSPRQVAPETTAKSRYQRMVSRFGLPARESLVCGCHVHVEVGSPEEGVAVLDRIRPWLALVSAVSANSPFWQEQDSGFASYRYPTWLSWPTAGPTGVFGSAAAYRETVEEMIGTGTILDEGMVYFDARLSSRYPTVEVRIADVCLDADTATLLGALARGLVETAARAWKAGEEPYAVRTEVLRLAAWRAARSGLGDQLLDPRSWRPVPAGAAVDGLLGHIGPALRDGGDDEQVVRHLARLRHRGNGAQVQRAALERTGDWGAVVRDAIELFAAAPES